MGNDYSKNQITNTFSIRHDLGRKGSLFLKTYIETIVKAALGRECKSIITEDSIVIELKTKSPLIARKGTLQEF
jgi:hypothetical protein